MGREELPPKPEHEPETETRSKTAIGATTCPDCTAGTCPKCGSKVPGVTLTSLLTEEAKARLASPEGFCFCGSPTCATVYWNPETGERFTKQDLRVRVGLKETTPPRPVCYCFGFAVEDIEAQVRESGTSTIPDEVTAMVRQRLCHCEDANPQGTCCLGNVRAAFKAAQEACGTVGRVSPNVSAERAAGAGPVPCCAEPGGSVCALPAGAASKAPAPSSVDTRACCAREAAPMSPIPPEGAASRAGLVSSIGAVVSAILASACCWLPLLLIAFGVSAASVAGFFEQYRLAFLGGAGILLALGFYFVYFRREACGPGGACAVPRPGLRRFNQVVLWIATALVVVAGAFPSYVGVFLHLRESKWSRPGRDRTESTAAPRLGPRAVYSIDGMTCEACTVTIRSELERLPGVARVEVSFEQKQATIWAAEPASLPPDALIVETVRRAGYVAVRR